MSQSGETTPTRTPDEELTIREAATRRYRPTMPDPTVTGHPADQDGGDRLESETEPREPGAELEEGEGERDGEEDESTRNEGRRADVAGQPQAEGDERPTETAMVGPTVQRRTRRDEGDVGTDVAGQLQAEGDGWPTGTATVGPPVRRRTRRDGGEVSDEDVGVSDRLRRAYNATRKLLKEAKEGA